MTRRENLLASMSGKPHDWVPICPVLDNANYIDPLPGYTGDKNDWVGQLLHVGYDTYDRGPGMIGPFETVNPSVTYESIENGQIMHTDWGDLRQKIEGAEVSVRVTEFLIKTPEDYKIYQKILESNRFVYKPENIEKNRKRLLRIGDRGIVNDMAAESPIMSLARDRKSVV